MKLFESIRSNVFRSLFSIKSRARDCKLEFYSFYDIGVACRSNIILKEIINKKQSASKQLATKKRKKGAKRFHQRSCFDWFFTRNFCDGKRIPLLIFPSVDRSQEGLSLKLLERDCIANRSPHEKFKRCATSRGDNVNRFFQSDITFSIP